jgi:hypothetical protein
MPPGPGGDGGRGEGASAQESTNSYPDFAGAFATGGAGGSGGAGGAAEPGSSFAGGDGGHGGAGGDAHAIADGLRTQPQPFGVGGLGVAARATGGAGGAGGAAGTGVFPGVAGTRGDGGDAEASASGINNAPPGENAVHVQTTAIGGDGANGGAATAHSEGLSTQDGVEVRLQAQSGSPESNARGGNGTDGAGGDAQSHSVGTALGTSLVMVKDAAQGGAGAFGGGAATSVAEGTGAGNGSVFVESKAVGGTGVDGGVASARAHGTGNYYVSVLAEQIGGDGSAVSQFGSGFGADSEIENGATATTSAIAILHQEARGGNGGAARYGVAGGGGSARSVLTHTEGADRISATATAFGGSSRAEHGFENAVTLQRGGDADARVEVENLTGEADASAAAVAGGGAVGGDASAVVHATGLRGIDGPAVSATSWGGAGVIGGRAYSEANSLVVETGGTDTRADALGGYGSETGGEASARASSIYDSDVAVAEVRAYARALGGDGLRQSGGDGGSATASGYGEATGGQDVRVSVGAGGGGGA